MDGADTLKSLITAGKRLEALGTGDVVDDGTLRESSRMVSEAGEAVARFRRLGEVQELLLEVTALVEAGVDPAEVREKLERAMKMASEIAIEFGLPALEASTKTPRPRVDRPTLTTLPPEGGAGTTG
jgi:hypothetical protein